MSEYVHCPACSEEITDDSDYCPHCGIIIQAAEDTLCEQHPLRPASGVCIICHKVMCTECSVMNLNRIFCPEHAEIEVQQDWALVYQSTEITNAELVKSVLESSGHKVSVQNFNSIGFVWGGGGDSSISRSNINMPAKVFVPIPEYSDAISTIEEWGDGEDGSADKEENT
jgi:RNA polymerase subunit RPABC4/transcription elongation factor Spt4